MDEKYYKKFRDSFLIDDIKSAYDDLSMNMNSIKTKEDKKDFIIFKKEFELPYICTLFFLFIVLLPLLYMTFMVLYYKMVEFTPKNTSIFLFSLCLIAFLLYWVVIVSAKLHFTMKLSEEYNSMFKK